MLGTCYMRSWQDFDLVSLAIVPLFLFSGAVLPAVVVPGVASHRGHGHAAVPGRSSAHAASTRGCSAQCSWCTRATLGALGTVGLVGASRRLGRLLLP